MSFLRLATSETSKDRNDQKSIVIRYGTIYRIPYEQPNSESFGIFAWCVWTITRRLSLKHHLHKYPSFTSANCFFSILIIIVFYSRQKDFLRTDHCSAMTKFSFINNVLFCLLQAVIVISSLPDGFIYGADLDFSTYDQQDPISAPVARDQTATLQGSANVFNNWAVNPSNVQSPNIPMNGQYDPSSSIQSSGGGNTALWFDESTGGGVGGTGIVIPSVPSQILEGVPEFIDSIGQWLSNRKKPECKANKHALCCQKGAPRLKGGKITVGRRPSFEPVVPPDLNEYSQRRKQCRSCRQIQPFTCSFPHFLKFKHSHENMHNVEEGLTKFVVGCFRERKWPSMRVAWKYILLLLQRRRTY